ncbi:hypothetical protein JANAI62_10590 [Jannaschia pagri]|uniref:HTH tetR-type domain-containing protein n=1 Tax=Jannaschia pagri TaxID=2829797 RepID=A0ABQ4NJ38_9RHOB|nr:MULTISPECIES: TetR/AcrR family transcriptional regulator [unclassified Jannaschia]GIT90604.1 hypothetical protein JANAI61_10620 [Jannaschia sp. AI_61]GIT94436.1 hypothetical protein JANAI62_10590 [Jannaschia sp. AI_62]
MTRATPEAGDVTRSAPARLSRTGWLDLALARLCADGPEALRLDAICAAAGKTKGSFYHHFADHDAFVLAVTERWIAVQTDAPTSRFAFNEMTEQDITELTRTILALDMSLEAGIRHLAETHDGVDRLLRETDTRRMDLMAGLYMRRFDLSEPLARDLSRIDYAAFVGLPVISPDLSAQERGRLYDVFDEMVKARFGPSRLETRDD